MQHTEIAEAKPIDAQVQNAENLALFAKWRQLKLAKKDSAAQRRHTRHECSSIGILSIANRSISLEGIVTEISKGGIKFRPASTHLLNRNGTQISVSFSTFRGTGKIVATRSDGYGVALFDELSDEVIEAFLKEQAALSLS